jgi:hypothetical protein
MGALLARQLKHANERRMQTVDQTAPIGSMDWHSRTGLWAKLESMFCTQWPQSTLKAYIQQNTLAPTIALEMFQKEMDSSNYKVPVSFQALMLVDQPRAARLGAFATPGNGA